jgi:hypothetical protein
MADNRVESLAGLFPNAKGAAGPVEPEQPDEPEQPTGDAKAPPVPAPAPEPAAKPSGGTAKRTTGRGKRGSSQSAPDASQGAGGKRDTRDDPNAREGQTQPPSAGDQSAEQPGNGEWTPPRRPFAGAPADRIPPHLYRSARASAGAYVAAERNAETRWMEWARDVERMRAEGVSEDAIAQLAAMLGAPVPDAQPG